MFFIARQKISIIFVLLSVLFQANQLSASEFVLSSSENSLWEAQVESVFEAILAELKTAESHNIQLVIDDRSFQVLNFLNSGYWGHAFLVYDKTRRVVLKIPKSLTLEFKDFDHTMRRNAYYLTYLRNIHEDFAPEVFELPSSGAFILMEYVEGPTVNELLNNGLLSGYFFALLDFFQELHERNIYVDDVTPDNIVYSYKKNKFVIVDPGKVLPLQQGLFVSSYARRLLSYFDYPAPFHQMIDEWQLLRKPSLQRGACLEAIKRVPSGSP